MIKRTNYIIRKKEHMIDIDIVKEEMDHFGYSIIKDCINKDLLLKIKSKVDDYYTKDQERFGKDFLLKVNELEQVRNVMEYDELFVELLEEHRDLDSCIEKLLNRNFIIHNYNMIRLFPDIKTNMLGHQWHRDVFYFGPGIRTAVNVMIPLQATNKTNGATELIPGSHLHERLPSEEIIKRNKIGANLEIGDVLLCDAATFHAAGSNDSTDTRTLIVLKYTLSFFTQQYDFCRSLPVNKYSDWMKGRIGYNVRVAESIEEFRVLPEDRKYKWTIRN